METTHFVVSIDRLPLDKSFGSPKMSVVATLDSVSASIQDYAKAVYALESRGGTAVSTNDLAERLGVTPGSVSAMVRKLSDVGLLEHEPYRGVRLTDQGRQVALEVLRHHRLIELFLAEELGMPWDRVHDEAEVLEHVISEDLERLIAARLGDPTVDPHGDPIPSAAFEVQEGDTRSVDELEPGSGGRFVRVSDSDPEMLRYLSEQGIALGERLEVTGRQPFGGPVFVRCAGRELPLGGQLARAMRIEVEEGR
jgi:DtxR family transcriptional regulator, Mn-dependent transcriptional regulator